MERETEKKDDDDDFQNTDPFETTELLEDAFPTPTPTTTTPTIFSNSSRYVLYKQSTSWVQANGYCNGRLATITNDEEAIELLSIVKESGDWAWIGLHENLWTNVWQWASGHSWSALHLRILYVFVSNQHKKSLI